MNFKVDSLINDILSRNINKNNILRKSTKLSNVITENIEYGGGGELYPKNGKRVTIAFDVANPTRYLKFIYSISSNNNEGEIRILCFGRQGESHTFDVGLINGLSIPYYIKTNFLVVKLIVEVKCSNPFIINQMESINITSLEYYSCKLKQYSIKFRNVLKNQPHLRKKFFSYLKKNGLKATMQKIESKVNNNSQENSIQFTNNPLKFSVNNNNSKVLFLSHDAQNAGASILALNMVRSLKETYKRDIIVLLLKGGPLEKEFAQVADVINLNQSSLSYLENEVEVNRIIGDLKMEGVNFCIANSVVTNILLKCLKKNDIETISLIHELPTSIKTYNFTTAAISAAHYAKKIVFPNDFVKDEFRKHFDVADNKIVIQPQGVFNKRTGPINENAYRDLRGKLNVNLDSRIVLGGGYGDLRKGLDLFFSTAKDYLSKYNERTHFVWMGECEPILKQWVLHDAKILGIDNNIHFIEFQKNPKPIYQGADLFLLSSREDPFPSIALEAIDNGIPVLTFEGSGGVSRLVSNLGINSIPYLDISSMSSEINRLLSNNELYRSIIESGHVLIDEEFNFNNYVGKVLELVDSTYSVASSLKVSVIIPNYNYENFIEERLNSIINQTVKPYEIIFLDDVSSDNSIRIARKILKDCGISNKIIINKSNAGCFNQWINGINHASGDVIWIAEADDLCEPTLLEQLLPFFKDGEVNLAYSQSQIIDENSMKVDYVYTQYTDDLSTVKWSSAYILSGREEVTQGLAIKNTIPNASAVLMRASALTEIEKYLKDYKISGDWFAYLYVIREGKIAFCPDILNYHRRHSNSIISKNEQNIRLYEEIINIKEYVINNYKLPSFLWNDFVEQLEKDYSRLGCKGYPSKNILDNVEIRNKYIALRGKIVKKMGNTNYLHEKKNLLFISPDFEIGGGQMLVVRLANFFSAYHNVYIYNSRPWLVDGKILKMISSSVVVLESTGDSEELKKHIVDNHIHTINSHIWWSDKVAYKAIKDIESVNWVLSMHGCYEALISNNDWEPEFIKMVPFMLERANSIVYAADKNLEIFSHITIENKNKLRKIYYGYDKQGTLKKNVSELGIKDGEFIFGLVSRAIKEKGWEESIKAIIELNSLINERAHLILVGEGEYAISLKEKYQNYDFIHFITNLTEQSEWIGWVKLFDVALLPTYFKSESLPNSIIEYLAYNKPVIATNIGEIKHMIFSEQEKKYAGILLELNHDKYVEVKDITNAMLIMATKEEVYTDFKRNTELLFEQFTMNKFASNYYELFDRSV